MRYWPLFPLLEFPHENAMRGLRQAFQDAKVSDADFSKVSFPDLVIAALRSGSTSWSSSAIQRLVAGFPIDKKIACAGDEWIRVKRGTQEDRHILFRLIRRWEKEDHLDANNA